MLFEDKFLETGGKPFEYNGKIIKLIEYLQLPSKRCQITISNLASNSKWEQGFVLSSDRFELPNGEVKTNPIRIWRRDIGNELTFKVFSENKYIKFHNVWDSGDGNVEYFHNGAALYSEKLINAYKIYCNDGYPDEDFDDLVVFIRINSLTE